jgi:protein-disulfide isomerase
MKVIGGNGLMVLAALLMIGAGTTPGALAQGGSFISIDDDPALGDARATVTIIEFGDYQCPFCRIFWKDTWPKLKRDYVDSGKVKFVFRDFPQSVHPEAVAAAMAAECAEDQGRYWPFHERLFREQDRRAQQGEVARFRTVELKRWAMDAGLEPMSFAECLDSGRHKDEVAKDYAEAAAVGIQGTPVFFINGRALFGAHPFATFQKLIEEELTK